MEIIFTSSYKIKLLKTNISFIFQLLDAIIECVLDLFCFLNVFCRNLLFGRDCRGLITFN
jgi:hypothetical protein